MQNLKFLKQKDLKQIRTEKVKEQNNTCPICKKKYKDEEFVVDHQHKNSNEELGVNGAGLVRGVICRYCNSYLGKIENNFKRYGFHNREIKLVDVLKGISFYIENNIITENLVHPTEVPKPKKLGKRDFKRIEKLYAQKYPRRKPLEYPKSGNVTKQIKKIAEEFGIDV